MEEKKKWIIFCIFVFYILYNEQNMSYNPDIQFRCTIIRGKSISRMDDYLSIYAEILKEICPIPVELFCDSFDEKLSHYFKEDKTIKNHRTENVDKLLGMYFEKDGIIYLSERTNAFIEDNDQPAFFKSVCYNFQQPNGSQKIPTIKEKVKNKIHFRPYHFTLALLKLAKENKVILSKQEVGYYTLNSLEVLQGKVSPKEVFLAILNARENKFERRVDTSKNYAWGFQHINEQFDYLELANLIRKDSKNIWINPKEIEVINFFIEELDKDLKFDFSRYDIQADKISKQIEQDWRLYYGQLTASERKIFCTSINSLNASKGTYLPTKQISTKDLGDEGEKLVLEYEKNIVKAFHPRLVNKINHHGKMKGLGYDITSIEANRDLLEKAEYIRYIEVKSTKRVHSPNFTDTLDTINLTRNEWVAAQQLSTQFYIYRVYFTSEGVFISIIKDPFAKNNSGKLFATPVSYRVEFNNNAVDEKYSKK